MRTIDPDTQLRRALGRCTASSSDFDLNPDVALPANRVLRDAGVLIGVMTTGSCPAVVLTKRSSRLKHHPGQIAFPGGKLDAGDGSPTDAALREAEEEIGLPRNLVEILGIMPPHETVTGFSVTPVVGLIRDTFDPVPEAGEVAEVFTAPLGHVMDPANFVVQSRRWRGQWRYYYTVPWGPYYIWGATARILRALADGMRA